MTESRLTTTLGGEWFAALQRLLPQHSLSRLLGKLANAETPWLKNALIQQAVRHYNIDLAEAESSSPGSYPSFNAFFTRALRAGARPIDPNPTAIVSPADGTISQAGRICQDSLLQAKGHQFSLTSLLGGNTADAKPFIGGSFATVYLSPRDYHRVHLPMDAELTQARYIPGRLFSVNDTTTRHIPGLFARNERLVCHFNLVSEKAAGKKMAVVMVGALFVAGVETCWQQYFHPGRQQLQHFGSGEQVFTKGDELGRFRFGSTVIALFEPDVQLTDHCRAGARIRMGEKLGDRAG